MTEGRIWGIQQRMPAGHWQTVFCHYDPMGQHAGNHFPFRQVDELAIKEFCEACLEIKYDTGDRDKDKALDEAAHEQNKAAAKVVSDRKQTELIANVIAGGDVKRFGALLAHEEMHAGPGVRFQHVFAGADLTKASGDE